VDQDHPTRVHPIHLVAPVAVPTEVVHTVEALVEVAHLAAAPTAAVRMVEAVAEDNLTRITSYKSLLLQQRFFL